MPGNDPPKGLMSIIGQEQSSAIAFEHVFPKRAVKP